MTTLTLDQACAELDASIERDERGEELAEEAARLAGDFRAFTYAAWPHLGYPSLHQNTWHVDALCDHYQAAIQRDITRLAVTIQPGAFKSTIYSVLGPAWAWTRRPQERFISASHADDLATRDTTRSRNFMQGAWFQARWGLDWSFAEGENMKTQYSNTRGGWRVRSHVGGGTGWRGTIAQVDDPHNAKEAQYADTQLREAIEWWSNTWVSRLDDTVDHPGAMIVIGQRIHQNDLIGFLLDSAPERWTHLCLPTRYMRKHPFRYPPKLRIKKGRRHVTLQGDPRKRDGDLLMPRYQDEGKLADRVSEDGVTAHIFAGQYQQLPTAREGKILKRAGWQYYPPAVSFYAGLHDPRFDPERVKALTSTGALPTFARIVNTWDTSVRDREHSDFVSGQAWGCPRDRPADRWLLRLWHERAGLNETIEAMLVLHRWVELMWPGVPVFDVIEKTANGPDSIAAIRSEVQGVIPYPEKGQALKSKEERAIAASPALEGGNCYLPGYANATGTDYDPRTPQDVQEFVEELAAFNQGAHDDQVDGWSCMVNYTRAPFRGKATAWKPSGRKPRPRGLPA